jgi:hypothetical protein
MGKWNCASCDLYLEDKRNLVEFPLGDTTVFCKNCAGLIDRKKINCRNCTKTIRMAESWRGRYCSQMCEDDYYKRKAAGAFE